MVDQGTEGLLSPFLRKKRIEAARPYLRGRVLDIGCGTGELARYVSPSHYFGYDQDQHSLQIAGKRFKEHEFHAKMPELQSFDTVVSLAVIEHVAHPELFFKNLSLYLRPNQESRIVITTPHPRFEWFHDVGARLGLFSSHANEEHETLFDKAALKNIADVANCPILLYRRFLFGANQILVLTPQSDNSNLELQNAGESIHQLATGRS